MTAPTQIRPRTPDEAARPGNDALSRLTAAFAEASEVAHELLAQLTDPEPDE